MKRSPGASAAFGAFAMSGCRRGRVRRQLGRAGLYPLASSISTRSPPPGPAALPALIERGRELFKAKFTTVDGAGRPKATQAIIPTKRKNGVNPPFSRTSGPDSNSCFGCHNDPVEGGSGDDVANVFVSEGFESAQFDTIDPSFSSERHTIALMGAGLVELLAREMTADLQAIRAAAVSAPAPRARTSAPTSSPRAYGSAGSSPIRTASSTSTRSTASTPTSSCRPFSRKGVFTSLRQFTINALNVHHGMEAVERFGVRWTGSHDFAESGVPDAMTAGDVSALVAFQATLPPPTVKADLPDDWRQAAAEGAKTVRRDRLPLLPREDLAPEVARLHRSRALRHGGNAARRRGQGRRSASTFPPCPSPRRCKQNDKGEWLIPLYSDLKRHLIVDETVNALGNELQAQRFVERDVFLTPRLWGVGSTAPYGHNGAFRMLDEIIVAHGGDARFSRDAYLALDPDKRDSVVAFLRSLVIEAP